MVNSIDFELIKYDTMTLYEIYKYPVGTPVKIKDSVNCHQMYHKGGTLIFQSGLQYDDDEFDFGIEVDNGVCFEFPAEDYELI